MPSRKKLVTHITPNGCHEVVSHNLDAYGYPELRFGGRRWKGHRWAWTEANGPIPEGMNVLHKCDNRKCINPDHLFLGTHADNVHDCMRKGRMRHGIRHHNAKLTTEQINTIIKRYNEEDATTLKSLGDEYGISFQQVSRLVHKQRRVRG